VLGVYRYSEGTLTESDETNGVHNGIQIRGPKFNAQFPSQYEAKPSFDLSVKPFTMTWALRICAASGRGRGYYNKLATVECFMPSTEDRSMAFIYFNVAIQI